MWVAAFSTLQQRKCHHNNKLYTYLHMYFFLYVYVCVCMPVVVCTSTIHLTSTAFLCSFFNCLVIAAIVAFGCLDAAHHVSRWYSWKCQSAVVGNLTFTRRPHATPPVHTHTIQHTYIYVYICTSEIWRVKPRLSDKPQNWAAGVYTLPDDWIDF